MRTMFLAATALAATALTAPAFAQDADPDFSGPRAEGVVGWDRAEDGGGVDSDAADGVVYGGAVGYDFNLGKVVLGVEGEVTGATTDTSATDVDVAGDSLEVSTGRDLYAGARIGVPVGSRALLYAKGGYTNAQLRTRYTAGTTTVEDSENMDGWRVGAGGELALTDKIYGKVEYRYSNYSSLDGYDIDLDRHQVVGGVGIRF